MSPCDWPLQYTNCDGGTTCSHLDGLDPETVDAIEEDAKGWLWEATYRRFGNCPVTLLPCLNGCRNNYGQPWTPYRMMAGSTSWINVGCAVCADTCACSSPSQVILPTRGSVVEVALDGVVLDPADWRLLSHQVLIRTDGGSWPSCQDLTADPPTWSVEFIPGQTVPAMGEILAGLLACQMARRLCGQACDLPANATSVIRQGVTIILDPTQQTGIWLIDQWVDRMNRPTSKAWSPDVPRVRTVAAAGSP